MYAVEALTYSGHCWVAQTTLDSRGDVVHTSMCVRSWTVGIVLVGEVVLIQSQEVPLYTCVRAYVCTYGNNLSVTYVTVNRFRISDYSINHLHRYIT